MFNFKTKRPFRKKNYDPYRERWWHGMRSGNSGKQKNILDQLHELDKDLPQNEVAHDHHKPDEPLNRQFPCAQCGAVQAYEPGSVNLVCEYCGHETLIEDNDVRIREYDFRSALKQLQNDHPNYQQPITKCENCAAEFAFDEHIHADECPFCGTHIVSTTGDTTKILK